MWMIQLVCDVTAGCAKLYWAVRLNAFINTGIHFIFFYPLDDSGFGCRAGLPPSWTMPRSFLVKRGGLHHPRPAAGSPSPGSTPVTFSQLKKKMGPRDTSLEYSTAETPDNNALLQKDIPATSHSNGREHLQLLGPRSYGAWHSYFMLF